MMHEDEEKQVKAQADMERLDRFKQQQEERTRALAIKCNLKYETVKDLMAQGWAYREGDTTGVPIFVHPLASLRRR